MNILVTGAAGFIGRNLCVFLNEAGFSNIAKITVDDNDASIVEKVKSADFIYHLAGINRPKNDEDFKKGNTDLTQKIIDTLIEAKLETPIVLTSSIQAELENPYGKSKAGAELAVAEYKKETGAATYIYRLPNVFGKWCRPNYNSAVATFCYNTINDLPITINNSEAALSLVYIDDVCQSFVDLLSNAPQSDEQYSHVEPIYQTTVGEVASLLAEFKESRESMISAEVGGGFVRALYSTYVSYLAPDQFAYSVTRHSDERGTFVEMLKTKDSGQFSFFTAHQGITRGGHYHHTKTEKFLVISGKASFKFRHITTGESYELIVGGEESRIVETAPGWSHDVTNIGESELIVMLWANEIFDPEKPDTVNFKV
ncbi:capsular biosynthesis protein [Vibrio sp. 10N.286.55.E10]|uniref:UDP-2-acetamido-2,6-beta-L-arabino-hexul-4-ose reductase n=1 Tax=unclassified Vibrio TaxID=2614977 RepID=UPI000C84B0BB|nr:MULTISPECIES: NAD-dependent epimerase/dehydratase family protein [unclassified Vibrio]PME25707.1 capsular biosynthesis protein [Vibrio sp. 10N.286.55.E12]PME35495.1 capsular biosynthesis protein [Vibrio sp. 10N.286.55.E10]PME66440.1 capsular biosynthesis protein [Vibrio sp. 10N.286.55.C11]PMI23396.1 capsular biosynthesis protein [Vibrio sp. 10N.286.46.E10]PMI99706.1 capsular biosynthesis protein [Vibrio sp. 10N.286.45.E10]